MEHLSTWAREEHGNPTVMEANRAWAEAESQAEGKVAQP